MVSRGPGWGVAYSDHLAVQWSLDGTLSLGLHVDPRRRRSARGPYGPYIDWHIGPLILSLGSHPARASDLPVLSGQGATMRPDGG